MINLLIKESKELFKEKENENTWFKIFTVLDKLIKELKTKEDVQISLPHTSELLIRSILSDRSRLNGIALELLRRCIELADESYNFNEFIGPVIKVSGRSNKVFINRALETIDLLALYTDIRSILKHISDNINNPNKNIRFCIFKIVCLRINRENAILMPFLEKGMKDPALEIRTLCKSSVGSATIVPEPKPEAVPKKSSILNLTPRKNFKVDKTHDEIKKIESEVAKITRDDLVRNPIKSEFFEKLEKIKKERSIPLEKKDDELTPRRLDSYLNRFRSKSMKDLAHTVTKPAQNAEFAENNTLSKSEPKKIVHSFSESNLQNSLHASINGENSIIKGESSAIGKQDAYRNDNLQGISSITNINEPRPENNMANNPKNEAKLYSYNNITLFLSETLLYKKELNSSSNAEKSVIHGTINSSVILEQIGTANSENGEDLQDIDNHSLILEDNDENYQLHDQIVSDISKSLINISIEPSKANINLENDNAYLDDKPENDLVQDSAKAPSIGVSYTSDPIHDAPVVEILSYPSENNLSVDSLQNSDASGKEKKFVLSEKMNDLEVNAQKECHGSLEGHEHIIQYPDEKYDCNPALENPQANSIESAETTDLPFPKLSDTPIHDVCSEPIAINENGSLYHENDQGLINIQDSDLKSSTSPSNQQFEASTNAIEDEIITYYTNNANLPDDNREEKHEEYENNEQNLNSTDELDAQNELNNDKHAQILSYYENCDLIQDENIEETSQNIDNSIFNDNQIEMVDENDLKNSMPTNESQPKTEELKLNSFSGNEAKDTLIHSNDPSSLSEKNVDPDNINQENARSNTSVESLCCLNQLEKNKLYEHTHDATIILGSENVADYHIQDTDFDMILDKDENGISAEDIEVSENLHNADQTIVLCSVKDEGVQNVFDAGSNSRITLHKIFSSNIFESTEDEPESKPVFNLSKHHNDNENDDRDLKSKLSLDNNLFSNNMHSFK